MPANNPIHNCLVRHASRPQIAAANKRNVPSPLEPAIFGVIKAAKTAIGTKRMKRNQNGGSGAVMNSPSNLEPNVTATMPATTSQKFMPEPFTRPPEQRPQG